MKGFSVAAGGQAERYGLLAYGKALTARHIEELDDSEIERLYARDEVRLRAAAARQKRLLKQLQAAKESLRPPVSAAGNDGTSASPKEAKRTDEWPEPN